MTEKELKKLSRIELLELMLDQGKEIDHLKEVIEDQKVKLADRSIRIENAGTIEEASASVNGVLKEAEDQAAEFLANINKMIEDQEKYCSNKSRATENKCTALKTITEERLAALKEETESYCAEMKKNAEEECSILSKQADEKLAKADNDIAVRETVLTEKCDALVKEAEDTCADLKKNAEDYCVNLAKDTDDQCATLIRNNDEICSKKMKAATDLYESKVKKAEDSVEARWTALTARLEAFYNAHNGLRELLGTDGSINR